MEKTITPQTLIAALRWRYATKSFDSTRKIPADVWAALEETLTLTPSSYNLQPWKFYVVTNQDLKEKMVPLAWRQRQVAEGSHVVVFAIKKNFGAKDVDRLISHTAELEGVPLASLDRFKTMLLAHVNNASAGFKIEEWAARQVYIALGNFMTAAAMLGIDVCPMEGFMPAKVDELLGLDKDGHAAVLMAVAGYRLPSDRHAARPKVRYKSEDVVAHLD